MIVLAFLLTLSSTVATGTDAPSSGCGSCWSVTRGVKWASKLDEAEVICSAHQIGQAKGDYILGRAPVYAKDWKDDCMRIDRIVIDQAKVEEKKQLSDDRRLVHGVAAGTVAHTEEFITPAEAMKRDFDAPWIQFQKGTPAGEPTMCSFSKKTQEYWDIGPCNK